MNNKKYAKDIEMLTSAIEKSGNKSDLYYQRGYFYYLSNDDEKAKLDYTKAVSFGLDFTEYPYYTFTNTNEKRREYILPEKLLIILVLIIVLITLFYQIFSFISNFKGYFNA